MDPYLRCLVGRIPIIHDILCIRNLEDDFEDDKEHPVVRFRVLDINDVEYVEEKVEQEYDDEEGVEIEKIQSIVNNKDAAHYLPCFCGTSLH